MVRVLLGTGCFPVDVRDCSDKTPLHYAALNGADEVFQVGRFSIYEIYFLFL